MHTVQVVNCQCSVKFSVWIMPVDVKSKNKYPTPKKENATDSLPRLECFQILEMHFRYAMFYLKTLSVMCKKKKCYQNIL